jgi:multidrug efflux system outer membrane protein
MAALIMAGCAVGPPYVKPEPDLPTSWASAAAGSAEFKSASWWAVYGDPVLDRLIDEALANNSNLLLAAARVDEARAILRSTAAEESPSASIGFDANRSRISQRVSQPLGTRIEPVRNNFRATLDVSYELDLWGRLRNATRAARAELLATEAARETVRITLTSDIAQGYFGLRALDDQLAATRRSLESRTESLALQKKRVDFGVLSEFEFRQREAEVAAARAQLPALERSRSQQENALALLLGRSPRAIYEGQLDPGPEVRDEASVIVVPSGIPSDLLLRRPDLVEAEQRLIAANARIGIARAYYFPAISLTGYFGGESVALGSLFSGPAGIWQFAAALTQPLWGGGRLESGVQAASARQQQALAQYQGAIQNAFRDVRDALVAQVKEREQLEAETQRVTALRETLRLAKLRYDNGLASQLDLLDAERSLLAAEQNRIDALRAQRAAIADLFKALGGSWT